MNEWVKRSIDVANAPGYLDNLSVIYPADMLPRRPLDSVTKQKIRSLYEKGDSANLVKFLVGLTKRGHPFPIEHPYASIFRQRPELIKKNPSVFQHLENIILTMPLDEIIRGCERPVDINRVMGQAFYNWLRQYFPNQRIPILPEANFERYSNGAFLDARNAEILNYLNRKFGYKLERGRDFLYKIGDKFVVGEARFLSTSGGSQTRDLNETIEFIKRVKGKVIAVGVLDGIVWFNNSYINRLSKLEDDEPALTVLLLKEFLNSIR
jgi:hypothetical protein